MFKYSKRSKKNLNECDKYLQLILKKLIKVFNHSVICGYRGMEEQNKAFKSGNSQLKFPHSMHNSMPSLAVDIIPYPEGYKDRDKLYYQAGMFMGIASVYGIKVKWGGDYNKDNDLKNDNFRDLAHFQIIQ